MTDRSATRVADAQRQAAGTLRVSIGFLLAAASAAASGAGEGPWLALHLFLVGGVLSAIAGATQMLAATWSAAPAPAERLVGAQRWTIGAGAVGVALGRELDVTALAVAGGLGVAVGLGLLAVGLLGIRRSGRTDRFHPSIDAYLAGIGCAAAGVALGVWMVGGEPTAAWVDVRAAHVTANLFGLVGVVIAGTLPAFAATQARTRMHDRASATARRTVVAVLTAGVGLTATGQLLDAGALAAAGRVAQLAGWLGTLALLPHVTRRNLDWAGPRLVQLAAGTAWWVAAIGALVPGDLDGRAPSTRVLAALAVGGVAQVLVASLAYLGPVIRAGGHERLSAGFATTRSWTSLVLGNVAAVTLLTGAEPVAAALIAAWALELAVRASALHRAPNTPHATIPEGP
ncbi:MAG TPA: hypothetical protein VFV42_00670 [Acidimicrobiales bacterium]|nr:hypothetical protein [Acidimicrobiales bacterium]